MNNKKLSVARTVGAFVAVAIVGTSSGSAMHAAGLSYRQSLQVCRFWHGGRTSHRAQLSPSEPYVAGCLRRQGWTPAGERVQTAG